MISILATAFALGSAVSAQSPVSSSAFNNIIKYTSFAAASYTDECTTPPFGSQVLGYFNEATTDVQAGLFQYDDAQQIVLAFRGTATPKGYDSDLFFTLTPLTATGTSCSSCKVHKGFQNSWNAISDNVLSAISSAQSSTGYSVVVTGHSLGGGIASIAAASLASLGNRVTVYTYGEPRNGNPAFTTYINGLVPSSRYFRVTHANDGVPQIPPTLLGFQHHGTEYWEQNSGTNTAGSVLQCPGVEPQSCNAGADFGSNPINAAHLFYSNGLIGNALHIAACGASNP